MLQGEINQHPIHESNWENELPYNDPKLGSLSVILVCSQMFIMILLYQILIQFCILLSVLLQHNSCGFEAPYWLFILLYIF
jgi:hypothetical protein